MSLPLTVAWLVRTVRRARCTKSFGSSTHSRRAGPECASAGPALYQTVKGALLLSPSPPRIAPSQLRLVDAGETTRGPASDGSITLPDYSVRGKFRQLRLDINRRWFGTRWRRRCLGVFCLSGCFSWLPDVVVTHPRRAASTDPGHRGCGAAEWVHASYRGRAGSERPPSVSDGDCVERRTRPDRPGAVPG